MKIILLFIYLFCIQYFKAKVSYYRYTIDITTYYSSRDTYTKISTKLINHRKFQLLHTNTFNTVKEISKTFVIVLKMASNAFWKQTRSSCILKQFR